MTFVCPLPQIWHEIYSNLLHAWEISGKICEKPPVPLILGGWNFSGDLEKNERWMATIAWTEKNGFANIIPELKEEERNYVNSYSPYTPRPWNRNYKPKEKPSDYLLMIYLGDLKKRWQEISGSNLYLITYPKCFSGKKRRRLLVYAIKSSAPPWGKWNVFLHHTSKHEFTKFRKRINDVISPHEVDHIDFELVDELKK